MCRVCAVGAVVDHVPDLRARVDQLAHVAQRGSDETLLVDLHLQSLEQAIRQVRLDFDLMQRPNFLSHMHVSA